MVCLFVFMYVELCKYGQTHLDVVLGVDSGGGQGMCIIAVYMGDTWRIRLNVGDAGCRIIIVATCYV